MSPRRLRLWILCGAALFAPQRISSPALAEPRPALCSTVSAQQTSSLPGTAPGLRESKPVFRRDALKETRLLDEVQESAFRFFWEKADPTTGLVNDRARNDGNDDYTVASIASTGYALAAL